MKRHSFEVGDQVRVRAGGALYIVTRIHRNGFACWIRQDGIAPNGRPYAEQQSDTSLLLHAPGAQSRTA
jgi:hypothetical protein